MDADQDDVLIGQDNQLNSSPPPEGDAASLHPPPVESTPPDADAQAPAHAPDDCAACRAASAEHVVTKAEIAPPPPRPAPVVVRGTITAIEEEDARVTLEDGREALIRRVDLADAQGKVAAQVGDALEAVIDPDRPPVEGEPVRLKKRGARAIALAALADAFASRTPIEGRVTSAIKGGYEVRIGSLRAFCPSSQISLRRDDVAGDPVGQVFTFTLSKFDPAGRSLVVSRRKLLEKEQKKLASGARDRIVDGARLTGTVVAFQPYGAFVDLGGVQGLLHVSEISHSRVQDPSNALAIGQEVEVVVLRHDPSFKKVSLSMKALSADPWEGAASSLAAGQVLLGTVRVAPGLGAFVQVLPGVEGLLHEADLAALSTAEGPPTEALVQITDVDARRHRIGLVRAPEGASAGDVVQPPRIEAGARIDGTVERIAPFGVFVRLAPGKTGLLHGSESKVRPGELEASFPIGSRVSVEILEISEDGGRIRLSRRTAAERSAASQARQQESDGPHRDGDGPRSDRGRPPSSDRGERGGFGSAPGARREDRSARPDRGPRGDRGGGRDSDRGDRGDRRRRRDEGGERFDNPAAAPGRAFASFGDALRQKLEGRKEEPAGDDEG